MHFNTILEIIVITRPIFVLEYYLLHSMISYQIARYRSQMLRKIKKQNVKKWFEILLNTPLLTEFCLKSRNL